MVGLNVGYGVNAYSDSLAIGRSYGQSVSSNNVTRKVSPAECETCRNRKYVDGSDEMVSFKAPARISPEQSFGRVRAHEQEHVNNAIAEGGKSNKELVSADVSLKLAVCPECGTSYVAGGVTSTMMRTYNSDPFSQNRKGLEAEALKGNNVDMRV